MGRNRFLLEICLRLAWCACLVAPSSAQHFKQVSGHLTQVAAGRNEVFGVNASHQVFRFNAVSKAFVQVSGTLTQVAVGGGTLSQKDEVWGLDRSGQIFHFNYATTTFNRVAGSLAQIVVGEGDMEKCHPYEIWGLDAAELIYRYNYCTKVFDLITGFLTHIATGGGSVWGLNSSAQIYTFPNAATGFVEIPGYLQQIAVGVNDVVGLDGYGDAWLFDPYSQVFYSFADAACCTQIAAGGDGIWAIAEGYPTHFYFSGPEEGYSLSGSTAVQIAVGFGAGVWAIDPSNRVYVFVRP